MGAVLPASEVCNGRDDDCNGKTDESSTGPTLTETCYTGPSTTASVGECKAGSRTCTAGRWGPCVGQWLPKPESCDGKDEDCDGVVDEGLVRSCYTGPAGTKGVGRCRAGVQICNAGSYGGCVGELLPAQEACNGQDDDCDGKVDGLTRPCYDGPAGTRGVGGCKDGTQLCSGGSWGACKGHTKPQAEVCNGKDDDCDGKTDEEASGAAMSRECYTGDPKTKGVGPCKAGREKCESGGWSGRCDGEVKPAAEACNGKDDDCDGTVDGKTAKCSAGLVCTGGKCVTPCTDDCTEGKTKCTGVMVSTCQKGSNGCTAWSSAKYCSIGYSCRNDACVEWCDSSRNCPIARRVCDPKSHRCVQCLRDQHCPVRNLRCDPVSHKCVRCYSDSHCQTGYVCANGSCAPGCKSDLDCGSGALCVNRRCIAAVRCGKDSDCTDQRTPKCLQSVCSKAPTVTLYQINGGKVASGARVTVSGVVQTTAVVRLSSSLRTFFVQEIAQANGSFRYGGMMVVLEPSLVSAAGKAGARLELYGTYAPYKGVPQIRLNAPPKALGSFPIPAPVSVPPGAVRTGGVDAAAYRGVLVKVAGVEVVNANPDGPSKDYLEFAVALPGDKAKDLRVDDLIDATSYVGSKPCYYKAGGASGDDSYCLAGDTCQACPSTARCSTDYGLCFPSGGNFRKDQRRKGDPFISITGVLAFLYGNSKLLPRGPTDLARLPKPPTR